MRLFLAIDPPQEIKKELDKQLYLLKKDHPQFRWVDAENFHITLHFFGDVVQYEDIAKRIGDILYDAESFYLYSQKMDVFVRRQLLLYLSFRREKKIEQLVTTVCADLGIEEETRYIPHITLSRSALSSKQQYFALKNKIEKMDIAIEWKVDEICLFQSILTGPQPVYKKLATFPLI